MLLPNRSTLFFAGLAATALFSLGCQGLQTRRAAPVSGSVVVPSDSDSFYVYDDGGALRLALDGTKNGELSHKSFPSAELGSPLHGATAPDLASVVYSEHLSRLSLFDNQAKWCSHGLEGLPNSIAMSEELTAVTDGKNAKVYNEDLGTYAVWDLKDLLEANEVSEVRYLLPLPEETFFLVSTKRSGLLSRAPSRVVLQILGVEGERQKSLIALPLYQNEQIGLDLQACSNDIDSVITAGKMAFESEGKNEYKLLVRAWSTRDLSGEELLRVYWPERQNGESTSPAAEIRQVSVQGSTIVTVHEDDMAYVFDADAERLLWSGEGVSSATIMENGSVVVSGPTGLRGVMDAGGSVMASPSDRVDRAVEAMNETVEDVVEEVTAEE
ncbi:MAG: hypothetical protein AAF368_09310 [Planctomycetota bacterium]